MRSRRLLVSIVMLFLGVRLLRAVLLALQVGVGLKRRLSGGAVRGVLFTGARQLLRVVASGSGRAVWLLQVLVHGAYGNDEFGRQEYKRGYGNIYRKKKKKMLAL